MLENKTLEVPKSQDEKENPAIRQLLEDFKKDRIAELSLKISRVSITDSDDLFAQNVESERPTLEEKQKWKDMSIARYEIEIKKLAVASESDLKKIMTDLLNEEEKKAASKVGSLERQKSGLESELGSVSERLDEQRKVLATIKDKLTQLGS
jgi:hypothetical protein